MDDLHAGAVLPRMPSSVPVARAFLTSALHGWHCDDAVVDDAALLVSELAGNVVRHVPNGDVALRVLLREGRLVVSVHDEGCTLPTMRHPGPSQTGGRGLLLVDAVADCWGSRVGTEGKSVWFELAA